jgi:hypothetical protein
MCGTMRIQKSNKTRKDTRITFYNIIAAAMLKYESKNWALKRSGRRKIETTEIRFLRHLWIYVLHLQTM